MSSEIPETSKDLNILVLGQTGAGKSTWINSFVNYLNYSTLEEAIEGGVITVLPANFTVTYDSVKTQVVEIGDVDANETYCIGRSATQSPRTYTFPHGDGFFRIIDTPGLGDTRGIEQDKENMRQVLDYISHLKELHGICILMKSNETRINVIIKFCIKELLIHLHKNAAKNILFCFTNSRGAFYGPGDTAGILKQLIAESNLDDLISLSEDTMYCLDNEGFRLLCALKYPNLGFLKRSLGIFKGSWEKSASETKRLFKRIQNLQPHAVVDTMTLVGIRHRILTLTKPLAEITQTIQINLVAIKDQEKKIKDYEGDLEQLATKLYMPRIDLEFEPLEYPRTVCTNSTCVEVVGLKQANIHLVEYVQICHTPCYLDDIVPEQYPCAELRKCYTMDENGEFCTECGCRWDVHMHFTYQQKRVETEVVNTVVEDEIKNKKSAQEQVHEHLLKLEEQTIKYQEEEKVIMQTSLKFGVFLKENAIAPYNDGFKDYLKYLIHQEEMKVNKTEVDDDLLNNLKDMMTRYEEEVRILEESMNQNNGTVTMTPEDVKNLEEQLYDLELTGEQIRKYADAATKANVRAKSFIEKEVPIKRVKGLQSFFQ